MDADLRLAEKMSGLGNDILALIGNIDAKALLYAQVKDGVTNAMLVYRLPGQQILKSAEGLEALHEDIQSAWRLSRTGSGLRTWDAIEYLVENRHMSVKLLYPGEVDFDDVLLMNVDTRIRSEYFPGLAYQ